MAKAKARDPYAKQPGETTAQWLSRIARHDQAQRDKSEPIVPAIALANGDYIDEFVTDDANCKVQTKLNRGGSPVMRWLRSNRLSEGQMLVIQHCLHLWAIAGLNPRVTAAYGERIGGSDYESERRVNSYVEALADLRRIGKYIPAPYMAVFENVCRFDEPAGVAGSRLGGSSRSNEDRAHTIVCMVADIIAMREGLIPVSRIT